MPKLTTLKLGRYRELQYDDSLTFLGLTWYRVHGGFGGKNNRTDWVADVPGACVSVSRWHNKKGFGWDGLLTRDEAMKQEVALALGRANWKMEELVGDLATVHEGIKRLTAAAAVAASPDA